ncbi:MAG: hypothetical protein RIB46_16065 [Pseudomonadales bacterium]
MIRINDLIRRTLGGLALAGSLVTGGSVLAQPAEQASDRTQDRAQTQTQEQAYGRQLMQQRRRR